MDIVDILRNKISVLEPGEHSTGLKATLSHIETAFRHLLRGQRDEDQTAFTDAVYRTNQAFEGAIKEAYRVLTKSNPENVRPYDIELHFSKSATFRRRVLDQFTNYRKEWRNPSTHDYKLDFNESEAFLAIVSVTAFSCLLLDEITQKIAHDKELAAVGKISDILISQSSHNDKSLLTRTVEALKIYFLRHVNQQATSVQWLGSVSGFLTATIPDAVVKIDTTVASKTSNVNVDLLVECEGEQVIVEIKHRINLLTYKDVVDQVENLVLSLGVSGGVLLFLPTMITSKDIYEGGGVLSDGNGKLNIISPMPLKNINHNKFSSV